MYEDMFNSAKDEQILLQRLVSPTRQAVNVARSYDVSERRAALESLADGEEKEDPPFVLTIRKIGESVLEGLTTDLNEDEPAADAVSCTSEETETQSEENPASDDKDSNAETHLLDDEAMDAKVTAAVAAIAKAFESDEYTSKKNLSEIIEKTRDIYEETQTDVSAGMVPDSYSDIVSHEIIDEKKESTLKYNPVDVDRFIDGLKIDDEITSAEISFSEDSIEPLTESDLSNPAEPENGISHRDSSSKKTVKALPLILFILIGVPVCALILMALCGVAAAMGYLAFAGIRIALLGIGTAFGSYAVFADILLVIGSSLIILALSVLCIWTAIWLLGGLCVRVVKYALKLAEKICCKEET